MMVTTHTKCMYNLCTQHMQLNTLIESSFQIIREYQHNVGLESGHYSEIFIGKYCIAEKLDHLAYVEKFRDKIKL